MNYLILVFTLILSTTVAAQPLLTDVSPLKNVNDLYTKAVETGDTTSLKSVMAEHFVITGGNGVQRNRKSEIAELTRPDIKLHFFRIENEKYFVYESSAVVTGQLVWKMTSAQGTESEVRRVFTFSYTRFPDGWKMTSQHIGRMPM